MDLQIMVSTGGTTLKDDILRLDEPVHVVVATPGRLLDLAQKGIADLSQCKMFVMDEADKLLSPEFTPVMESLLQLCHKDRQVMLFSATFPMIVKDFRVRISRNILRLQGSANIFWRTFAGSQYEEPVRNQLDGGTDAARCHPILRFCRGTAKSPLSQHPVL
jgi:ATP-dependent RNA helicase DDX6/DHH1